MVVLGVMAGTDSLVRASIPVPGRDPKMFYIVPLTDMLLFATFIYVAFRNRFHPPAHKRAIYLATTTLLIAAIARLPFAFSYRNNQVAGALTNIFLVALIAYDLWSTRRIRRVTLWAGTFMVIVQQIRIPIGKTAAWHVFATWVQNHAR
jgi:FtsH-binding integral membrane protein